MGSCKHINETLFCMKCAQFVGWLLQNNPAALSLFFYLCIYIFSQNPTLQNIKFQNVGVIVLTVPSAAVCFNCFVSRSRTQIPVATQRDNTSL